MAVFVPALRSEPWSDSVSGKFLRAATKRSSARHSKLQLRYSLVYSSVHRWNDIGLVRAIFSPGTWGAAFAQEEPAREHYSAVWVVTGGSGGGTSVPIDIRINRYNSNEEISQYATLLVNSGPTGLRSALEKVDVGQFSPVGKVGTPLAVARKLVNGDKTEIRVLTLRIMSFAELRNGGRSVDYPYTMLDLVIDKNGKGTGTAIGAAKIRFDKKKNVYEIESFRHGAEYNKLLNIQLMK